MFWKFKIQEKLPLMQCEFKLNKNNGRVYESKKQTNMFL